MQAFQALRQTQGLWFLLWVEKIWKKLAYDPGLRSASLWNFAQRRLAAPYQCLGQAIGHIFNVQTASWTWDRQVVAKRRSRAATLGCVKFYKNADLIYIAAEAWYPGLFSVTKPLFAWELKSSGKTFISGIHKNLTKSCSKFKWNPQKPNEFYAI
jgi:hypothetical protein